MAWSVVPSPSTHVSRGVDSWLGLLPANEWAIVNYDDVPHVDILYKYAVHILTVGLLFFLYLLFVSGLRFNLTLWHVTRQHKLRRVSSYELFYLDMVPALLPSMLLGRWNRKLFYHFVESFVCFARQMGKCQRGRPRVRAILDMVWGSDIQFSTVYYNNSFLCILSGIVNEFNFNKTSI